MKKNLLLMMMCVPALLAAQGNGVKVSNLSVDAGTVTFNVSWNKADMPDVWSDTVWVFVDYNNNGVMERLLVTGATASAGTVTKISSNDKGVWIAGDARKNGSFSATVRLFTSVSNVAGACAYASNYPPVGEYTSIDKVEFAGTPMYEIQFAKPGGGSVTVMSGDTLLLPCDYTLTSFTDATGALGRMKNSVILPNCTAPGSTVNFTTFNPCSDAATGAMWNLTDSREPSNIQTYKVKKLPDGHIWMVQDLKFGDKCGNKTSFSGSTYNQQGKVSSTFPQYYGDCSNIRETSTPVDRGYFYDWAAVMNKSGAYTGSTSAVGCTGTGNSANICQGICPVGWHVPTGDADGEYRALDAAIADPNRCTTPSCSYSLFEAEAGGWLTPTPSSSLVYAPYAYYTTSSICLTSQVMVAGGYLNTMGQYLCRSDMTFSSAIRLRCLKNY
jgi:uncharacterized protein (TIGR02145 family)